MISPRFKIRLLETLGFGSFSSVYKAKFTENNEYVAVKCMRNFIVTASDCDEVANEIAVLKVLRHPNVLTLKFYEINKSFTYIGTEFARYNSLKRYQDQVRGPLTEVEVKYIMTQLCSALCYIHGYGILHGDIKPANILCFAVTNYGPTIKLSDFGLSHIILKGKNLIKYGGGSFFYMAPENHKRQLVDTRSDLWSTGVVMYKLMFNRKIYDVSDRQKQKFMHLITHSAPLDFSGCVKYSYECSNLLMYLLQFDMNRRIKSIELPMHPFVRFTPVVESSERFLLDGDAILKKSFETFTKDDLGEALAEAYRGVYQLKIFHNITDMGDRQKEYREKLRECEPYLIKLQQAFIEFSSRYSCPRNCTIEQFRNYLVSTPKLLEAFDIGYNAELYLRHGNKTKALSMFHQSVQSLLPLLKHERKSNRRLLLGKKVKQWIKVIDYLQTDLETETEVPQEDE
ncbi:hypothetical protein GWI33_017444 [Rhynchophorus ferrugineus]|uniref:Protein kinase domain-containing protein n=1 Tax=Rhynchophorus ferrugineus TaxID=354439 RepID=A0A834HYP2_RHYFE|nr:hypothetical protein GWI33_017444 [Rhynchophorus ferrugineus]